MYKTRLENEFVDSGIGNTVDPISYGSLETKDDFSLVSPETTSDHTTSYPTKSGHYWPRLGLEDTGLSYKGDSYIPPPVLPWNSGLDTPWLLDEGFLGKGEIGEYSCSSAGYETGLTTCSSLYSHEFSPPWPQTSISPNSLLQTSTLMMPPYLPSFQSFGGVQSQMRQMPSDASIVGSPHNLAAPEFKIHDPLASHLWTPLQLCLSTGPTSTYAEAYHNSALNVPGKEEEQNDYDSGPISITHSSPTVPLSAYACNKCPRQFRLACDLRKHQVTHCKDSERLYPCDDCAARFYYSKDLMRHRRTRHPSGNINKMFQCTVVGCEKQYLRRDRVLRHEKKHHPSSFKKDSTPPLPQPNDRTNISIKPRSEGV
ncbi:hypothetical protein GQ43DRAFT_478022 [Delitschia confertaspora ATCC 74209]|uniref:C2H2-type domain-containing protein n=1 Tax=Delitschia confertaspora ATCC 74209 TaxID=1513339 RepID=A0A9P4MSY1_9PLEO|nr:hypothetical protein GQ43DRAFT_478022 [Delitschia confertaspora ATCC 74209]